MAFSEKCMYPKCCTTALTIISLVTEIKQMSCKNTYFTIVKSGKSSQSLANKLPSLEEVKKFEKYILPSPPNPFLL